MLIRKVHHVAYRCIDAKETVQWYEKHLGMNFVLAIAEDEVPSTKEPDPYMHVFLDAGQGNVLAFFELPTRAPMDRDRNTPAWVQHLALEVDSVGDAAGYEGAAGGEGIEVRGADRPHDLQVDLLLRSRTGIAWSWLPTPATPAMMKKLDEVKRDMLDEWSRTKRAPKHAAWMHDGSLAQE